MLMWQSIIMMLAISLKHKKNNSTAKCGMHVQGPKLRFPGRQCDQKYCAGDQNFTAGHQWAINYAISRHESFDSQANFFDQNEIQSCPPIGHFLFTFPLLWKYKTDFLLL